MANSIQFYPPTTRPVEQYDTDPTLGEEPYSILLAAATTTLVSGAMRVGYWQPTRTETVTKIRFSVAGQGAAATPTLIRMGVWSTNSSSDATALLASSANDTTKFTGTFTESELVFSTPWAKTAGVVYAVGLLIVSGTTMPTISGTAPPTAVSAVNRRHGRRFSGQLSGQSDLPATFLGSALATSSFSPYFRCLLT